MTMVIRDYYQGRVDECLSAFEGLSGWELQAIEAAWPHNRLASDVRVILHARRLVESNPTLWAFSRYAWTRIEPMAQQRHTRTFQYPRQVRDALHEASVAILASRPPSHSLGLLAEYLTPTQYALLVQPACQAPTLRRLLSPAPTAV